MAATRTLQHYATIRFPLFILFFSVMIMSIVFTFISLNGNMEPPHNWHLTANQPDSLKSSKWESDSWVENQITSENRSPKAVNEPFQEIYQRRRSYIRALQRFKSKLILSQSANRRNSSSKYGWKLLPGNTVVHDGEFDNPHDYPYLTNPTNACKGVFNEQHLKIVIFVESDARNSDRRRVIRSTWALPMLQRALNFKVIFLLGAARTKTVQEKINDEYYAYGDVVQENFTESFKHLALKSVMGLKWVQTYCVEADFAMKTDDDILVHVPNLISTLLQLQDKKKVLLCRKNRSRQIIRHGSPFIKYHVSTYELPGSFFPPYCGGFAYVMSKDAVSALYAASIHTPLFFIEDVYITGFCRHKVGIDIMDHSNIVLRPHLTVEQAPCSFAEGRITSHELNTAEMQSIWDALNTRGFFCPVPVAPINNSAAFLTG